MGVAPSSSYRIPSLSGVENGVITMIRIESADGSEWEICESVIAIVGPSYVYSRGEIQASSTGARVNFSSGTKHIYFVIGQKYLYADKNIIKATAGPNLSGHRVVYAASGAMNYADSNTQSHATLAVGITTNAASSGAPVYVQTSGEMEEPSFTFTPNQPIYLGSNGALTQAVPTSGFILQVAVAMTATRIAISIKTPIII